MTELKNASIKPEAWELCKEFLLGPWKEVPLDEFRLFEVRGGLSNTLYRCALPENATVDDDDATTPKEVLLRIYGALHDDEAVGTADVVTFMLLSERKLGPKLYGIFNKGRLEEFIPSHSLSSDELRKYSTSIAREIAKIHALEIPVRKVPDVLQTWVAKWLKEAEEFIINDKENDFMPVDEYRKEIEWLSIEMTRTESPVVYCHNDLQGGNILYREDSTKNGKPNLMLIDFEFGFYNHRGFDIANHMCEWCFDYNTPDFPHYVFNFEKFPSKQEQAEFCSAYLDQLTKEGVQLKKSLKEETEAMMKEINIFASAAHLLWSAWSIKMTRAANSEDFGHANCDQTSSRENHNPQTGSTSSDDRHWKERLESTIIASIKEHCKTRTKLYRKFKELHLESSTDR